MARESALLTKGTLLFSRKTQVQCPTSVPMITMIIIMSLSIHHTCQPEVGVKQPGYNPGFDAMNLFI